MSWNPFKVKETSPSEPPSEALVIAKKELPELISKPLISSNAV